MESTTMKKNEYMIPEMQVVEMNIKQLLMVSARPEGLGGGVTNEEYDPSNPPASW